MESFSDDSNSDFGEEAPLFWGLELLPGKKYEQTPERDLHITQAALSANAKSTERNSIQCSVEGKVFTLGSLRLNGVEQFGLDIYFAAGESASFFVTGKDSVHLSGYYPPSEAPPMPLEDWDSDEEEGNEMMMDTQASTRRLTYGSDSEELEGEEEEEEEEEEETPMPPPQPKKTKAQKKQEKKEREAAEANGNAKRKSEEVAEKSTLKKPKLSEAPERVEAAKTPKKDKTPKTPTPKTPKTPTPNVKESPAVGTPRPGSTPLKAPQKKVLPNGLVMEDILLGTGAPAKEGKKVSVKYVGKLTNGKTFDSSLQRPFSFRLGIGQVIKGWDVGVRGMRVGGKRNLTIPANLAYGAQGAPPSIPGNATLNFQIELVEA